MCKVIVARGKWVKLYSKRKLLGKLFMHDTDQPGCYISHFEIKPGCRNAGNGSYLLTSALEYAKAMNCTAASLHCSLSNAGAIRFYERHGFFIAATTTKARYSNETGLVERNYLMVKQLN